MVPYVHLHNGSEGFGLYVDDSLDHLGLFDREEARAAAIIRRFIFTLWRQIFAEEFPKRRFITDFMLLIR